MRESAVRSRRRNRTEIPFGRREAARMDGRPRRKRREEVRNAAETILAGQAGACVAASAFPAAIARAGARLAIAGLAGVMSGGERRAEAIGDRQRLKRQNDSRRHAAERELTHSPPVGKIPRLKLRGVRVAGNLAQCARRRFSLIRVNYVTDFAMRMGAAPALTAGADAFRIPLRRDAS